MKIRTSFVTNSSSSSFVLAFNKGEKWRSYEYFSETCSDYGYEEFFRLIERLKKNPSNTSKEEALDFLFRFYTHEYCQQLLRETVKDSDFENYSDCLAARIQLEKTPAFQAKLAKFAKSNPEYVSKVKQIENADLVVKGTVWDTNGGIMEWAIRNGFVSENFKGNHVVTWNVG